MKCSDSLSPVGECLLPTSGQKDTEQQNMEENKGHPLFPFFALHCVCLSQKYAVRKIRTTIDGGSTRSAKMKKETFGFVFVGSLVFLSLYLSLSPFLQC